MVRTIFCTHQTTGTRAGVCACDRTHQMEKAGGGRGINGKLLLSLLLLLLLLLLLILLLLTVNDFIKGKSYLLTVFCKDDIAVYTWDPNFSNFLRCISRSRRTKQTRKISFFEKLEMES